MFWSKRCAIALIIVIIISNIYIRYINQKYQSFWIECKSEVTFNSIVISEPVEKEYAYIYKVKGIEGLYKNKKFLVYVNKTEKYNIKYGDLINLTGEFNKPSSARNYKGFKYKEYLKTKEIYGTIIINNIEILENNKVNFVFLISNNIKKKIKNNIKMALPKEAANLLIGLILGDKNNLSEDIIESFKNSNLSHMLAVSGAHVTYIILGLTYILQKIRVHKRKINIITSLFLVFLMFITGFTPSVVRACIMAIIFLASKIFYRKADFITNISLSLLIILIENPFSINNIGLQLSYLGTIGIVFFNKEVKSLLSKIKFKKRIIDLISITISAQLMIMPIMILKFNTLSTTFLISNLLAVLPFGASIILGFITIIISFLSIKIAKVLSLILNIFLNCLIFISQKISEVPFSNIFLTTPNIITIIVYYIILICIKYICLIFKKTQKRKFEVKILKFIRAKTVKKVLVIILVALVLIDVFPKIKKVITSELDVYFIDVGQGDSTFITTPLNKTILIDGGDGKNEVLLPYILDRKVKVINFLIISHFDSDHCNGIIPILENLKVNNLYISKQSEITDEYKNIINIAKRKNIKVSLIKAGDKINIEKKINIEVLYPKNNLDYVDSNNNSVVCKLNYNNFSMLFTGDIEKSEEDIIKTYKNTTKLKSNIIKIAHHGSKNSSSEQLLELINPKMAIIGVGKNNKFGHPSQEVLDTLEKYKIKAYRTDLHGEIHIRVNKNKYILITKVNNKNGD